jgi:DNA polymerase III epsilon subunit-like protein
MYSLRDIVVLDLETTGTNPVIHDPVSMALVPLADHLPPLSLAIRPPSPVWSEYAAANFSRFESEWIHAAVSPTEALLQIEQYLGLLCEGRDAIVVGHNVGFDLAFLRKLAAYSGKDDVTGISHRSVDTHSILFVAWLLGKIPEEALTSDGAFRHFQIIVPPEARHTALGDAIATKALFIRILELLGKVFPAAPIGLT